MNNKIPCAVCGTPSPFDEGDHRAVEYLGAVRCTNCWEVEHRLEQYMKVPGVLRKHIPLLDDWVDNQPDAWDYEKVLEENRVSVEYEDSEPRGWGMAWEHGCMHIGQTSKVNARKAAALFVSLWQRGVSASFADKLMDGFITYLERQENTSLTFLAEVDYSCDHGNFFRVTREGYCKRA